MQRFLLASFDYLRPKDPDISLASSSILAHLKSVFCKGDSRKLDIVHRQYNVRRASIEEVKHQFLNDLHSIRPNIMGTGIYVWNEPFITAAFNGARMSYPALTTVLGGPQITYNPKGTLEHLYPYGDIFIRGYAEQSLSKLLDHFIEDTSGTFPIEGVHYKGQPDLGMKSLYELSSLESPLLTPGVVNHKGYLRLETKRGCPFTCAFCQHKDSYEKRFECNLDRVKLEIETLITQNVNDVSIVDPIFNSGSNYIQVLETFLEKGYKGRLSLQSRFEMVRDDYLDLCTSLLSSGVEIELEFGIQTIIAPESKVIRRRNNLKRVLEAANQLHSREIPFEVSLIYGLPLQTLDSFQSSLNWVHGFLKPGLVHAWPLMLLKGTEIYDKKQEFKLIEKCLNEDLEEIDDDKRQYAGIPHVVKSSTFSEDEWHQMKEIGLNLNTDK